MRRTPRLRAVCLHILFSHLRAIQLRDTGFPVSMVILSHPAAYENLIFLSLPCRSMTEIPAVYSPDSLAQPRVAATACFQPLSCFSLSASSIAGVNSLSMAQFRMTSSLLSQ